MPAHQYDIVIIGSGAGGGTVAHALSATGARILLVERGAEVPREPENWSPDAVWRQLRYRARERWLDEAGAEFSPYIHYCVGGNTKFWGSVLYRFRREDFGALRHVDGESPAWPIDYDTLEPYYDRAERLYYVRGDAAADPTEPPRKPFPYPPVDHSAAMAAIVARLERQGLHPSPLPLGLLRPGEADGCALCNTCNSFPCQLHAKSEAHVCCVLPATLQPTVTLWTNAYARRLVTNPAGTRVTAVEIERGGDVHRVEAPLVIAACGAVNSAALLLRSASDRHPHGLANSSGLVGRRYMAHLATMISAIVPWKRNPTVFQKTVAVNDYYLSGPSGYPLGQIQSQGRIHPEMMRSGAPPKLRSKAERVPLWVYRHFWASRSVDWLAMSEDLPLPENRVTLTADGRVRLHYRPNNVAAHAELVRETKRILRRVGLYFPVAVSLGTGNTTHQCGTAVFGTDPRLSVLDPYCRAHDVENLFVVDASFFPSSAAVNPGLTIAAQALRVADHIAANDLRVGETTPARAAREVR
jgi:choline dehydrogenase-like flavoprotein